MKGIRYHVSLTLTFFCLATSAGAHEFSDPLARKLTDFLPSYTPFIPPSPPERYFPDEVGEQVADAIIDAYLQDPTAIEQRVHALAQHDARLVTQGERTTGLTPYVRALTHPPSATDEQAASTLAELDVSPDELLAQADQLLADEKRTRLGRMLNWVLSTFDVGSLFAGTPRNPSPYSAQGVVSSWSGKDDPSPRERKALALYREFLRRAPEDPRAPEVEKQVEELDARRRAALLEAELTRAEAAFEQHDYWRANFHYQLALMIDESASQARAGLEKVEARLQQYEPLDEHKPQDPLDPVWQAEWEHDKETLKYLLPGSSFVKDNFVVAGVQIATEGLVGAATFGALTTVQTGMKLWRVLTGKAVSHQGVITAAEKYIHNTPQTERSAEVYTLLAQAYEKEGQLDKAITYYELAGMADRVPKLQEQAGAALLELADQSKHQVQKTAYLRTIVERYPDTDAAREAAPQLRELSRPEHQGLHLSKAFLKENRELVGPQGLGLKPALLDDDRDNVELTNEGLVLLPSGEIALWLQSDQGPQTKVYAVPSVSWGRFWRRFREKGYEQAALHGDKSLARLVQGVEAADITLKSQREKNAEEGWRMLPYLSGSLSGSSVDLRGILPREIAGTRLAFGTDQRSTYVGMEVPMPFIPVDFLFLGRSGMPSLYPRIRLPGQAVQHEELYQ